METAPSFSRISVLNNASAANQSIAGIDELVNWCRCFFSFKRWL